MSGALLALAFPPCGVAWLAPLALVPWIAALFAETGRRRALGSGVVFGLVFWCASIPWIAFVVTHFGGQPGWMGPVCVFLLAAILAEWPALVAWTLVSAVPARSPWRLAAFPVLWMASEHARSVVYKGFPWNLTANALADHPRWLQTASWWGAYGVGALVAAAGALIVAAAVARTPRGRIAAIAALVAGAILVGVGGTRALARPEVAAGAPVRIACVQPNVPQVVRETADGAARQYATVIDAIRGAARSGPDLILVPESSFYGVTWQRSPVLQADLSAIARESGASILFNDLDEQNADAYYNAARLVTPTGLASATYRKVHLVPFGEYVPLPRLFFFMKSVSQAVGAFSAAKAPVVIPSGRLVLGPAICYEMTYPSLPRRETRDGANLLVTISNDAWYGKAGAQEQHFAAMVLRAIENGRPFARAAITGISGVVDARGRVVARLGADVSGVVDAAVAPRSARTIWTRWGGAVFPAAADLVAIGMVLSAIVRLRRGIRP
ncbi:MAG TPA: apolipoprotein N-acyltransferase [Thermoanaerobaculia bacterium]|nr:apolipoprotein N-acyltransferase [Thermoanaerobaculia bacterium]